MSCDDSKKDKWYRSKHVHTWKELLKLYNDEYNKPASNSLRWVFRGDRPGGQLQTKLEKAFSDYGVKRKDKKKYELETVRAFQRKAALYLEHEPDKDDILEWLGVMRHYGAPTRLLDCTYSFYIAVYFALAENEKGVVWVFNGARFNKPKSAKAKIENAGGRRELEKIQKTLEPLGDLLGIRSSGEKLDDFAIVHYLMKRPMPLVSAVNPFRLNRRLTTQQGLFLLAGNPSVSFQENLDGCFTNERDLRDNVHRISLEPSKAGRNAILFELKKMNISNEVLFPGLDGFAKSLGERFAYPGVFPPGT